MKTLLPAFLAILLSAAPGFAADTKPHSAAGGSSSSLVEVGKTYAFHGGATDIDSAKVLRIVNDNWIEVQYGEVKVLVNLQHLDYISEESGKPADKD